MQLIESVPNRLVKDTVFAIDIRKNNPQPAGIWFSITSECQLDSARQTSALGLSVPVPSSVTSSSSPLSVISRRVAPERWAFWAISRRTDDGLSKK
ncbi:MAG: hypothetical protein A4E57_00817 [Syntrophorhabdaceae bacterium PtaU1.Bin034]|nr:MAG: hypothetical protein A4E57_00817 [Syntrophorhabdaceae bacterium PtaU1.Bin034]